MESQAPAENRQNPQQKEVQNLSVTVDTLSALVNSKGNPKELIKALEVVMP